VRLIIGRYYKRHVNSISISGMYRWLLLLTSVRPGLPHLWKRWPLQRRWRCGLSHTVASTVAAPATALRVRVGVGAHCIMQVPHSISLFSDSLRRVVTLIPLRIYNPNASLMSTTAVFGMDHITAANTPQTPIAQKDPSATSPSASSPPSIPIAVRR
jgi:hypothetical protein